MFDLCGSGALDLKDSVLPINLAFATTPALAGAGGMQMQNVNQGGKNEFLGGSFQLSFRVLRLSAALADGRHAPIIIR